MKIDLSGRVALVTGASRGIGAAIGLTLARAGAVVIGTGTTPDSREKVNQMLTAEDLQGRGVILNLGQADAVENLAAELDELDLKPDILVNNAGVTRDGLLVRMTEDDWDTVIQTNLSSVYKLSKTFLRAMMKARYGRIINITSVVAAMGNAGQTNYAAAKAGMIGFSKSLAGEVGSRGITVNAVAPGFIDTDMTRALAPEQSEALVGQIPLNRLGTAEEVAAAVAFLASPLADYITGETLNVNGGLHMV